VVEYVDFPIQFGDRARRRGLIDDLLDLLLTLILELVFQFVRVAGAPSRQGAIVRK